MDLKAKVKIPQGHIGERLEDGHKRHLRQSDFFFLYAFRFCFLHSHGSDARILQDRHVSRSPFLLLCVEGCGHWWRVSRIAAVLLTSKHREANEDTKLEKVMQYTPAGRTSVICTLRPKIRGRSKANSSAIERIWTRPFNRSITNEFALVKYSRSSASTQ